MSKYTRVAVHVKSNEPAIPRLFWWGKSPSNAIKSAKAYAAEVVTKGVLEEDEGNPGKSILHPPHKIQSVVIENLDTEVPEEPQV